MRYVTPEVVFWSIAICWAMVPLLIIKLFFY